MSQSPRESEDVDPQAPSPDENDQSEQPESKPQSDQQQQQQQQSQPPGEGRDMSRPEDIGYDFEVKEQDRWLPIANVARIMKTALPENAKIAKEAKECMQECVSEFISFITSEASEKCQQEKRKTVNGEDILFAMTSLGFENYGEALKIYLARYRENMVARGEHPRPATGGAPGAAGAPTGPYDGANHGVLGNQMDASTENAAQFGYDVPHPGQSDY